MNETKKITLRVLQENHDLEQSKPIIDTQTRWNSTFDMLTWSINNKQVELYLLIILKLKPLMAMMIEAKCEFNHWDSLVSLHSYLSIFEKVTSNVASQKSVSISLALIYIESLICNVQSVIRETETSNII